MARWATVCEIAGISFTGCRAQLLNANDFIDPYAGSLDWGNDGTPHPQWLNRSVRGIQFGVVFLSIEIVKLQNLATAVAAAQALNNTFRINVVEAPFNVDVNGIVDPTSNQGWMQYGNRHSEGWAEDMTLLFVSKSLYT